MNLNKVIFLGTGTSQGVPMIGCSCHVCRSESNKDKRLRTAAYIEYDGVKFVIDCGPDFRQQMLAHSINELDAVLLTHQHKDHTGGLDDIRAYNYLQRPHFLSTQRSACRNRSKRSTHTHLTKTNTPVFPNIT